MANRIPGDEEDDIYNDMESETLPDSTPRREGGEDSNAERTQAVNPTSQAIENITLNNKVDYHTSNNRNTGEEETKQDTDTSDRNNKQI